MYKGSSLRTLHREYIAERYSICQRAGTQLCFPTKKCWICDEFSQQCPIQRFNVFRNTSTHSQRYMPGFQIITYPGWLASYLGVSGMDMFFFCIDRRGMWKKGSYDVSGKQEHDSNRLSVVVLSADDHHGETLSRLIWMLTVNSSSFLTKLIVYDGGADCVLLS